MKTLKNLSLSLLVLAFCTMGFAQTKTPKLDKKESIQQKKIADGIKSGTLTKKEAAQLKRKELKLQSMEAKAKSDGKVTKGERVRLNKEANKLDKAINKEKHDQQNRPK